MDRHMQKRKSLPERRNFQEKSLPDIIRHHEMYIKNEEDAHSAPSSRSNSFRRSFEWTNSNKLLSVVPRNSQKNRKYRCHRFTVPSVIIVNTHTSYFRSSLWAEGIWSGWWSRMSIFFVLNVHFMMSYYIRLKYSTSQTIFRNILWFLLSRKNRETLILFTLCVI
jgi:hypothetical protein